MPKNTLLDQLRAAREGRPVVAAPTGRAAEGIKIVGLYARISDAYEGKETGVTEDGVNRQIEDNRVEAVRRGWTVAEKLYIDNSLSAYKEGVVRDAFEELLEDLEAGVIDGIVCYNLDRFVRRPTDLERAIRIYDKGRVANRELLFATKEGDLDLTSDSGLSFARIMVAFANKASRDTARRVARKHQATREEGRPVGGFRPFGWDWERAQLVGADGLPFEGKRYHVINEREAAAIRRAAAGLTDGSMNWMDVFRDWSSEFKTPRGTEWRPTTIKAVMRSPRLAGWMVHKGEIAAHSRTGLGIRSLSPAILTDDEFEALQVAMSTAKRSPHMNSKAKYLLAGIVRCGQCGGRMTGNRRDDNYHYYNCKPGELTNGKRACGKIACSGVSLDAFVTDIVLPRIIGETADVTQNVERPHVARLIEIEDEKNEYLAALREKRASSAVVFPEVTRLETEADELRRQQAEWLREQRVTQRSVGVTEKSWAEMDVHVRRGHIARHIEAIFIAPSTRRGNTFDLSRVSEPVWRSRGSSAELPPAELP